MTLCSVRSVCARPQSKEDSVTLWPDTVSLVGSGTVTVSMCNSARVITWKTHTIPPTMYEIYYSFAFVLYISKTLDTANFAFKSTSLFLKMISLIEIEKKVTFVGVKFGFFNS